MDKRNRDRDSQNIVDLVEAIRKKRTFRQLVVYNVQLLQKAVAPSRDRSWEAKAKAAYEVGALSLLAELLQRFPGAPEIFQASINTMSAICRFPAHVEGLYNSDCASTVPAAILKYWENAMNNPQSVSADVEENMAVGIQMLRSLATSDVIAFDKIDGVNTIISIASAAAQGVTNSASGSSTEAMKTVKLRLARVAEGAITVLDYVSRSGSGVKVLTRSSFLQNMLETATVRFVEPSTDQRRHVSSVFKQRRLQRSGASHSNSGPKHLASLLRVLDRVCRTEDGIRCLKEIDATTPLTSTLELVQGDPALLSLLVRVLGRLLDGNLTQIVDQVCSSSDSHQSDLSATLLMNLMREEEHRDLLIKTNGGRNINKLLDCLNTQESRGVRAAVAGALREIAGHGDAARQILLDQDMISILLDNIGENADDDRLVTEASAALAELITNQVEAQRLVTYSSKTSDEDWNGLDVLCHTMRCHQQCNDGGDAVCGSLLAIEKMMFHAARDIDLDTKLKVSEIATTAMTNAQTNLELQAIATDVCIYISDSSKVVSSLVDNMMIQQLIHNLQSDRQVTFKLGVGRSEDNEETAQLIASSLYLMATICTVPENVPISKELGCIQGILAGFTSFPNHPTIYQNFREVIRVLGIDKTEVHTAINHLHFWTLQLRDKSQRKDLFRFADEVLSNSSFEFDESVAPQEKSTTIDAMSGTGIAEKILEAASLLEAVAVSPHLASAIVDRDGVSTVLHSLATVSVCRAISAEQEGGRKLPNSTVGILEPLLDKLLARMCSTLSQLARLAYEIAAGTAIDDEASRKKNEDVVFRDDRIPESVYQRKTCETLARVMPAQSKLSQFASAAVTLASWLSVGPDHSSARAHVETVVTSSVVEGVVGILRAHQANLVICREAVEALARVAGAGRGAVAVATRGATRQLIRMLSDMALQQNEQADAILLGMLQLLETCTAQSEAADILRKQGIVDAVANCVEQIMAGHAEGGGSSAAVQTPTRVAINSAIASLLGRLVDRQEVEAIVNSLEADTTQIMDATSQYRAHSKLTWGSFQPNYTRSLVRKFGLFATTDAGWQAGSTILAIGFKLCLQIGLAAVKVADADDWDEPVSGTGQAELHSTLPLSLLAMQKALDQLAALASATNEHIDLSQELQQAVPFLLQMADQQPSLSSLAISLLVRCVEASDTAISAIATALNGRGLKVLVSTLRLAGEQSNEALSAACMKVLASAAKDNSAREELRKLDCVSLALNQLGDMVQDAAADSLAPAIELLAEFTCDAEACTQLLSGSVLGLVRLAVQRHCSDPYKPNERLLTVSALLLRRMISTPGVFLDQSSSADRLSEARTALRRFIKAGQVSTGYLNDPACMIELLNLLVKAADPNVLGEELSTANIEFMLASQADDLIILAMSSSSATAAVLDVGRDALQALGLTSRLQQFVDDIRMRCDTSIQWLNAGWPPEADEFLEVVRGITDALRSLSATVAGGSGLEPSVFKSVFPALSDCTRVADQIYSRVNKFTDVQGLQKVQKARADLTGLSVQIASRLVPLCVNDVNKAHEGVPLCEVISFANASLRSGVVALGVVESSCRCLQASLDHQRNIAVQAFLDAGTIHTLSRLLRLVRRASNRYRLTGNMPNTATAIETLISGNDLPKIEDLLQRALSSISSAISEDIPNMDPVKDGNKLLEGLLAAAGSQTADADLLSQQSTSAQQYQLNAIAQSLTAHPRSMEFFDGMLQSIAGMIRPLALRAGGAFAVDSSLQSAEHTTNQAFEDEAQSAEGLQARVRVMHAMLKSLNASNLTGSNDSSAYIAPGHVERLRALFLSLRSSEDMYYGVGRRWRRKKWDTTSKTPNPGPARRKGAFRANTILRDCIRQVVAMNRMRSSGDLWGGASRSDIDQTLEQQLSESTLEYARMIRDDTLTLLANTDFSKADDNCERLLCNKNILGDLIELITSRASERSVVLAGIKAASRLLGTDNSRTAPLSTVKAFCDAGFFNACAHAISLPAHQDDEEIARSVISIVNSITSRPDLDVADTQLDAKSLLIFQSSLRRFPNSEVIQDAGSSLIHTLSEIHQSQSGEAFAEKCRAVSKAFELVHGIRRYYDGVSYEYELEDGSKSPNAPYKFATFLNTCWEMHSMSRTLDESAVTAVERALFQSFTSILDFHQHDPGVSGMILAALSKLIDNDENQGHIISVGVTSVAVKCCRTHRTDPRVCETFAALMLPLSFEISANETILQYSVTDLFVEHLTTFQDLSTLYTGSKLAWPPTGLEAENEREVYVDDTHADATEKNKHEIRLARLAVQTIANLACSNIIEGTAEGGTASTVDLIVQHQGIEALGNLMRRHLHDMRLLEDAMCALSNIAFVNSEVQLTIGRTCIDMVIRTVRIFHHDEHLFRMALRAIGNLTRNDENIMRVVGFGAIGGIVSGMSAHVKSEDVLKLAADVIGNLASVDEKQVSLAQTTSILKECNASRAETEAEDRKRTVRAGGDPLTLNASSATLDSVESVLSESRSTKEAVCQVLYRDGGPRALIDAIDRYPTKEALVTACLRALHYSAGSEQLIEKMIDELDLVSKVVLAMRSCDFNAELLRRGVRVLGQALAVERAREYVLRTGVPQVLLSAIETHHSTTPKDDSIEESEKVASVLGLCSSCYAVLHEIPCDDVYNAVREGRSVATTLQVLHENRKNLQYTAMIISVLDGWISQQDLAEQVAREGMPILLQVAAEHANDNEHSIYILASIIQLSAKLSEISTNVNPILESNVIAVVDAVIGGIMEEDRAKPEAEKPMAYRTVTIQCLLLFEKLCSAGREAVLNVLRQGGWQILRDIEDLYQNLRNNAQYFFDRETCELVHKIMGMCQEHDIPRALEQRLVGFRQKSSAVAARLGVTAPGAPDNDPAANIASTVLTDELANNSVAKTILEDMQNEEYILTYWEGNLNTPCTLKHLTLSQSITITPDAKKKFTPDVINLSLRRAGPIVKGNPPDYKKKLLGRSAKASRSIVINSPDLPQAVHLEFVDAHERDSFALLIERLIKKAST